MQKISGKAQNNHSGNGRYHRFGPFSAAYHCIKRIPIFTAYASELCEDSNPAKPIQTAEDSVADSIPQTSIFFKTRTVTNSCGVALISLHLHGTIPAEMYPFQ
jgi:hypothetical protein